MEVIKRILLDLRGEEIELLSGVLESDTELESVKDLIRIEYQRRGYISPELSFFDDGFDDSSAYFGTFANGVLVAGARIIDAKSLPTEHLYYRFAHPPALAQCPRKLLREVSRLTAVKRPGENPLPRHFVSTTIISTLIDYGFKLGLCGGVSTIKVSFLRLFERLNLPALHEILDAELVYPQDKVISNFFYDKEHPAVPIYYLNDEAKAIFDGLFHSTARTGITLLGDRVSIMSDEVSI